MICPHCGKETEESPIVSIEGTIGQLYEKKPEWHKRPWGNTFDSVEYCGSLSCPWMYTNVMQVIAVVAQSIAKDFPESTDSRLIVGDCSPIYGQCFGHPVGSHSNRIDCDVNYYTVGTKNYTQYRPKGEPSMSSFVLDTERTFLFLYRLQQVAPSVVYRIHSTHLSRIREEFPSFYPTLNVVESDGFNHDKHCHLSMRGEYNYDFNVKDFLEAR